MGKNKALESETNKERYKMYKKAGICVSCGQKDAVPGLTMCPECLEKHKLSTEEYGRKPENKEKMKDYRRRRRERLKAAKICTSCGKRQAVPGKTLCKSCASLFNAKAREKRGYTYGERARERRDNGVCMNCGGPVVPGYCFCADCLLKHQTASAKGALKTKEAKQNSLASRNK